MKLRYLILFLFIAVVWTASAEQPPGVLPFEPAELLSVLPEAPPDWTVMRSDADETLGNWLETRATRIFQAPSPTNGTASVAPALPGEVRISVLDTAAYAPALAAFADFAPSRNGEMEKKLIGTLPTLVYAKENGAKLTQILVLSRFIVEVTLTNLPHDRVEDWLRGFHFDSLPAESKATTSRPNEFRLSRVDELHPEANRSYFVSTTSTERLAAFLKSLPPGQTAAAPVEQPPPRRP